MGGFWGGSLGILGSFWVELGLCGDLGGEGSPHSCFIFAPSLISASSYFTSPLITPCPHYFMFLHINFFLNFFPLPPLMPPPQVGHPPALPPCPPPPDDAEEEFLLRLHHVLLEVGGGGGRVIFGVKKVDFGAGNGNVSYLKGGLIPQFWGSLHCCRLWWGRAQTPPTSFEPKNPKFASKNPNVGSEIPFMGE